MKSRDEYKASIFSKRDALLAKRKKHITQSVTAAAAFILIIVSAFVITSLTEKLPHDNDPTDLITESAVYEKNITQPHSDYNSMVEDNETSENQADKFSPTTYVSAGALPEAATEELTLCINYPIQKSHPNILHSDRYSEEYIDGILSVNDGLPDEEGIEAQREYPETEIADTAFSHLSPIQKAECIDKDNPHIMPVTSSSWSVYYVTFRTNSKHSYRVILRQSDLEHVENVIIYEKETQKETEPVTFKDGYKGGTQ